MKIGVFLPTYVRSSGDFDAILRFARRAEELGFDSLWATDHLLEASRFYSVAWLEPLLTLSHVAAVTSEVELGTSVLVMPLRHPVMLAKQVATLQALSDRRYILGVGAGWDEREFQAVGTRKKERGRRTDEAIDVVRGLLNGSKSNFTGVFYPVSEVSIEPRIDPPPPVWAAGGSQLAHALSPEKPEMNPAVLRRIINADGWIARATVPPDLIASDVELIRDGVGERASAYTFAHENFVSLDEGRPEQIRESQREKFLSVLSDARPWDYIEKVYLTGTIDEVQEKIAARRDAGINYLLVHTLTDDLAELERLAKYVLEPFQETDV